MIGKTVIATNSSGARYRGIVKAETSDGRVIIACTYVDIGYGWEREEQERVFRVEQIEVTSLDPQPVWRLVDVEGLE